MAEEIPPKAVRMRTIRRRKRAHIMTICHGMPHWNEQESGMQQDNTPYDTSHNMVGAEARRHDRSSLHALPSLGATTTAPQSQKGGAHCAHAPLGRFPRLVLTIKPGCSAQRPTHVEWSGGGGAHVQEGSRQSLISTPTHLAQCPLHSPSCLPASKTARERTCFSRPAHCVRHRPLPQPTRPRHGAEFAPAESAQRTRVPGPNRAADASEFPDAS